MRKTFFTTLLLLLLGTMARADVMRPAYLEFRETTEDTYDVVFKVPAKGANQRLALRIVLPDDSKTIVPAKTTFTGTAFVERSTITRKNGLAGAKISIDGLTKTSTEALVRIEGLKGNSQTGRLSPAKPSMIVTAAPSSFSVAKTYTILGIQHILEGFDHLLFVLCLMIVAGISRKLLLTITGFTIAHSLTLALSTLDIVTIPMPPVEAVIALSIVFLASEIVRGDQTCLTYRYPVTVSMSFGLLHGFGFAAVLGEIGLPPSEIPVSLLFFNVGVELGQLLFIGALIILLRIALFLWKSTRPHTDIPTRWQPAAAYFIGTLATFWTIERVASFWSLQ
jgi:hydrogenase/urease accessory protein HupE